MSLPGYESIEPTIPSPDAMPNFIRRIAQCVVRLMQGKANNVIEVTLRANAATTVVSDARLHYYQAAVFDPMTANAAAELAAGTLYVTQAHRLTGQWTLTNANSAQTDRTFRMILAG